MQTQASQSDASPHPQSIPLLCLHALLVIPSLAPSGPEKQEKDVGNGRVAGTGTDDTFIQKKGKG